MKRTRLVFLFCLLLLLTVSFCSCKQEKAYTTEEICDMLSASVFQDKQSVPLDALQIQNYVYFDIQTASDYTVLVSTEDEKYSILAAIKPNTKKDREELIKSIDKSVSGAQNMYKSLNDSEFKKISNRLLYEKNGIIILVVSDNYELVVKELKSIGAKAIK